jgi:hypothetical protein
MSAQIPSPRKSRRRLAITLRVMMLLTLVLAGGLSYKVRRTQRQKRAIAHIKRAGGEFSMTMATRWRAHPGRQPGCAVSRLQR